MSWAFAYGRNMRGVLFGTFGRKGASSGKANFAERRAYGAGRRDGKRSGRARADLCLPV